MIYSPIENQVSKRISFPDVRPKVTHENFTWSNTWSGSSLHYYQDFVLSEQFPLATTLITADHMGANAATAAEGFSFEIIDDSGGTIVRIWYRYNNKVEPTALRVRIVQGLSYVAYEEWSATGASGAGDNVNETMTIATISNWDATGTGVETLWGGANVLYGKGSGTGYFKNMYNLRTTDASTLAWTWDTSSVALQTHNFVVWRA
jgi:hypothetical protein